MVSNPIPLFVVLIKLSGGKQSCDNGKEVGYEKNNKTRNKTLLLTWQNYKLNYGLCGHVHLQLQDIQNESDLWTMFCVILCKLKSN